MNCPNCGAPLPDPAGRPNVVCDHCGSVIALRPPAAAITPAEPAAPEPRGEYGPTPDQPLARSELTSLALGPADASHVIQLLLNHQESEAVQFYQARVGGSLADAKDAIGAIREGLHDAAAPRGARATFTPQSAADLPEVRRYLDAGNRLEAVKAYRAATGAGLREAVAAIDGLQRQSGAGLVFAAQPMSAPARSENRAGRLGCLVAGFGVVALCLCILGGCGGYVQTTAIYKCSLRDIKTQLAKQEILTPPIDGGYLVLVHSFHQTGDISRWYLDADYFAPVWGGNGWGIVDANIQAASSGSNSVTARLFKDGNWRPLLSSGKIVCVN